MSSQSNRNKLNNQRTSRKPILPNARNLKPSTTTKRSIFSPNSYNTNYNTRKDYTMNEENYKAANYKVTKPASFGLFNYLESPFYAKKLNDSNSRKYRQKVIKQQQYWNYQTNRTKPMSGLVPGAMFYNCKLY